MTHESMSREALALKRQALQQQLGLQRQLITATLSRGAAGNDAYPRSMTMRFLTEQPALAATLFAELSSLLLGARLIKSIGIALAAGRIVQAATSARKNSTP